MRLMAGARPFLYKVETRLRPESSHARLSLLGFPVPPELLHSVGRKDPGPDVVLLLLLS